MAAADDNVQSVLDRVATAVAESGRKIVENRDISNAVQELNGCKTNLRRISAFVATDIFQSIDNAIDSMLQLARQTQHQSNSPDLSLLSSSNVPLQQQGLCFFCSLATVSRCSRKLLVIY